MYAVSIHIKNTNLLSYNSYFIVQKNQIFLFTSVNL
jgi:hypothetical protein